MEFLHRSRYALGICAAILLAGCGQSTSTLPQSNASTPSMPLGHLMSGLAQSLTRGGAFSGGYSGTYYDSGCRKNLGETSTFTGTGKASFLFRSSESGSGGAPWTGLHGGACRPWTGAATIMSERNPQNSITLNLEGGHGPCYQQQLSWTVAKGAGKFKNATGSGTLVFTCRNSTYTDSWTGTVNY
jgi:hypothetical protein